MIAKISKVLFISLAFLIITSSSFKAAAEDSFGILDIMSRVDITNVDNEKIKMFHDVTDFFVTKLSDVPNIVIYDLSNDSTKARLDEIYLQMNKGNCSEFKDFNCKYIIYGYLMNLTISEGRRIGEKSDAVRADLSIRVIDTHSGKCVFVATGTGTSKARQYSVFKYRIQGSSFSEEELHSALEEAVDNIMIKFKKNV